MLAFSLELSTPFSHSAKILSTSEVVIGAIGTERVNVVRMVVRSYPKPLALPTQQGAELLVPVAIYTLDEYDEHTHLTNVLVPIYTYNCTQNDPEDAAGRFNLDHAPITDVEAMVGKEYLYTVELNASKTLTVLSELVGESVSKLVPLVGGYLTVKNYTYNALLASEFAKFVIRESMSGVTGFVPSINEDGDLVIGSGAALTEDIFVVNSVDEVVDLDFDNVNESEFAIVAVSLDLNAGAILLNYGESAETEGGVGEAPYPEAETAYPICSVIITKEDDGYGNIVESIVDGSLVPSE